MCIIVSNRNKLAVIKIEYNTDLYLEIVLNKFIW